MNSPRRAYSSPLRVAAAAATQDRIRQAAIALHQERLWDGFTLDEVAARAGTTVQTILRVFGSKRAIETLALLASEARERGASPPGDIPAAITALYDDYAQIGDQVIRLLAEEMRQPGLAARLASGRRKHRQWVEQVFAPQLSAREGEARDVLLHALIAATDVYAWKLLLRDLGLDRPRAEAVSRLMVASLLSARSA